MKTLLVLTDFSDAATHAAKYAAILSNQLKVDRIILFNRIPGVTSIPSSPFIVNAAHEEIEDAMVHLKQLANELKFLKASTTEIHYFVKEGHLDELTNELIIKYQVTCVVMGLTGKSRLEQTLIGSNTLKIAKTVIKPLLIVPESARLTPITKVTVLLDLFDIQHAQAVTTLIQPLTQHHKVDVFILSHEYLHSPSNGIHSHNLQAVRERMEKFKPAYHTIDEIDVVNEVLQFSKVQQASLIVHVEKKRNIFESIFLTDITERMAYVSPIPLLLSKLP